MPDVFISYAREDGAIAKRLTDMLKASDLTVFDDDIGLVAGESFSKTIAKALADARAVVVLLSRNSKRSKWVEEELALALEKGHRVIPVLLDSDATDNWVWPLVSDRHAITVKSDASLDEVVREIERSEVQPSQWGGEMSMVPVKADGRTAPQWSILLVAVASGLLGAFITWLVK